MVDEKPWYESRTIWGSLIAVAAALSAAMGITIDGATQAELASVVVQITGAAGSLLAIYGRLVATDIIA